MSKNIYAAILWLGVVLLACHALRMAGAATIYVATTGVDNTEEGRGQSWALPYLTISNAVKKATTVNDLVLVSNGYYTLAAPITVSSQITVRSWNNGAVDPTNTIVNGNAAVRCFNISHTGAVVEGLKIYNGYTNGGHGGGVNMTAGTLRNCIVVSNSAPANSGGGIYIFSSGGIGLVDSCVIESNVAAYNGGGINFTYIVGAILVTNCVIRYNRMIPATETYEDGGGVYQCYAGTVMANCSVYGNFAHYGGGGGVFLFAGIMKNCVVSNNYSDGDAYGGGGGIKTQANPTITNCVIISNVCFSYGGGIHLRDVATIANCRIIGNQATNTSHGSGGGVYVQNVGNIFNSDIRDNFAGNQGGGVYANGISITMRNCLIAGNAGNNGGGGVLLRYYNNVLENCTIVSNRGAYYGDYYGGGLHMVNAGTNFFANSIIYFNTVSSGIYSNYSPNGSAVVMAGFSNCCFSPVLSGASINYSANNITVDPRFADKDSGNWRLSKDSPCVDAGVNRDWMIPPGSGTVDLDGRSRLDRFSGIVDMGCYEYIFLNGIVTSIE